MIFFRNGDRFLIKSFSVILNFIRLIILGNIIYFFDFLKFYSTKKNIKKNIIFLQKFYFLIYLNKHSLKSFVYKIMSLFIFYRAHKSFCSQKIKI